MRVGVAAVSGADRIASHPRTCGKKSAPVAVIQGVEAMSMHRGRTVSGARIAPRARQRKESVGSTDAPAKQALSSQTSDPGGAASLISAKTSTQRRAAPIRGLNVVVGTARSGGAGVGVAGGVAAASSAAAALSSGWRGDHTDTETHANRSNEATTSASSSSPSAA